MHYYNKYLKYKGKYIILKKQIGGDDIKACYIVIEDENGNTFEGMNGVNLVSTQDISNIGIIGEYGDKTLKEFLEQIGIRMKIQILDYEILKEKLINSGIPESDFDRPIIDLVNEFAKNLPPGLFNNIEKYLEEKIFICFPDKLSYIIEDNIKINIRAHPNPEVPMSPVGGQKKIGQETELQCLEREIKEEINVNLQDICTNLNSTIIHKPSQIILNTLYLQEYKGNKAIYFIRVSEENKNKILSKYKEVKDKKTEIYHGDFRKSNEHIHFQENDAKVIYEETKKYFDEKSKEIATIRGLRNKKYVPPGRRSPFYDLLRLSPTPTDSGRSSPVNFN